MFYPVGLAQRRAAVDAVADSIAIFTGDIASNQLRPIRSNNDGAGAQIERFFDTFTGGEAGPGIVMGIIDDFGA